jgi:chemotaxis protein methyltransferase CheR
MNAPLEILPVDDARGRIAELARASTGLWVHERDLGRLALWAAGRASALALSGIEPYGALLAEDSVSGRRERELLTVRFSNGETYFFRDQGQMELLAATLLPRLIERRAAQRSLRLWSAGCASGEEAYSLAMLVDELAPRVDGWNILILGTDINAEAIRKAKEGSYGQWSFRALDAARKQRYFRERGGEWKIDPRLRDMVRFSQGDLLHDRYPEPGTELHDMDLILCRNVLIYFAPQAVAEITAKLAGTLADGGTLMTGHTELVGHPTGSLRVRVFPGSVVLQKTAQAAAPPLPALRAPLRSAPPAPAARAASVPPAAAAQTIAPAAALEALLAAAWLEANRGARDAAAATCRKATAIAGFDPRPYYLLAQLALERGNAEETKTLLKKVIYLDPSFIAAYMDLGALYERDSNTVRARQMHENARRELKKLPPQTRVRLYGESTVGEILAFVERQLAQPPEQSGAAVSHSSGKAHG